MNITLAPFVGVILALIVFICLFAGVGLTIATLVVILISSGGFKIGLVTLIVILLGIFCHQVVTNAKVGKV